MIAHVSRKRESLTFSSGWRNLNFVREFGEQIGIERSVPSPGFGTPYRTSTASRRVQAYRIQVYWVDPLGYKTTRKFE